MCRGVLVRLVVFELLDLAQRVEQQQLWGKGQGVWNGQLCGMARSAVEGQRVEQQQQLWGRQTVEAAHLWLPVLVEVGMHVDREERADGDVQPQPVQRRPPAEVEGDCRRRGRRRSEKSKEGPPGREMAISEKIMEGRAGDGHLTSRRRGWSVG